MTTRRNFLCYSALGVVAVTAMLVASGNTVSGQTNHLKVGVAREVITPELGGLFLGYGSDMGSTVVHDDLTVTALALEYDESRVVLMSATDCLLDNDLVATLQTACGEAADVPAANVIIAATHTHSGPVTAAFDHDMDIEYCEQILTPKCVAAAKAAVNAMKPATVGVATTESKVGINRRQIFPNDGVGLGQNRWGLYDSEMTVVSFKGDDGKPIANMVHCSAHCTAAGRNTEVTRDWPGVMIDRLESESGAITLFFNGLCGDLSPRIANGRATGDINHVMEVGALAGLDAVRAYQDIRVYRDEVLSVATGVVRIPHAPLIPLEEARQELAKLESGEQARFTRKNMNVLRKNIEAHENGETGESFFTYPQTLVRIGSIVLIPVPFEASTEISLRLRDYSKYGHTLAIGNTNGANSYLPTRDQITRGGYEVDMFKWSGARRLADNADTHLINQNLELMKNLESGVSE
ncbi:MAG: hypothetical protein FWH27_12110 [Planctomycetaceae bacterium]|nr:hypothetical protein [Planctomycetaceae bacterium]